MAMNPAIEEVRENPFFIIAGPGGRRLACQWTSFDDNGALGCEFEVVCPETPEAMGCLFGLLEDETFRMRPAFRDNALAPELDLDLTWRAGPEAILETGHDFEMGDDGLLFIYDSEEPAVDTAPESARLRRAA